MRSRRGCHPASRSSAAVRFEIPGENASAKFARSPEPTRSIASSRNRLTMSETEDGAILLALDDATRTLVRLAAVIAGGSENDVRAALAAAAPVVPHPWIEELLLQTYLFAGFP